ncbi:MAG: ABC transporter substrate-binding protein [Clostridiales bacterium]|nr:ABC transporter substrate-binding protein [Clostridiales bacterium]
MKTKKIIAVLLVMIMLLGSLAACGGGKDDDGLKDMTVVLDWYPNAVHAFLYTAIERGYFEEEGLDVTIQFPSNENDALSLVAAGKVDIGVYYQQDVIQAVADADAEIKCIGSVVQSPLNIILSLKEKGITSPADLEGKTVGYAGTALSEALVYSMLDYVGADRENVELVNVGFDLMSSMTTGNVDATIGCFVNHEVPQMEKEGFEVNYFMVDDYGVPEYYDLVFVANNKAIEEDTETLAAFLRAADKGFDDFQADPEGCLAILLENQNEENFPLDPDVEAVSIDTLLPLMEKENSPFLAQSKELWQNNIDWMLESGLIDEAPEVEDVMVEINL